MNRMKTLFLIAVFVFFTNTIATANVKYLKVYKDAYPDPKPQCMFCHVDKLPKKDDGKHDLNEYGKKVKEAAKTPEEVNFTEVGPYDEKAEAK